VAVKEPWQVSSLLWDLQQAELERKVEPMPEKPSKTHARLELLTAGKTLAVLAWEGAPPGESSPGEGTATRRVWVEEGGQSRAFDVSSGTIGRVEESLSRVLTGQKE
jgi:hypothetical protein